jgi:hypothetical protein
MLLLIPHLFPTGQLLKAAAPDLCLPALQSLLARGTRQACPDKGVEAALCDELGISRQLDWPLAPITLAADGGVPGDAYWLRADPVHLQVMRDRIVLADNDSIVLSREEADALAGSIGGHFGADLNPLPLHPQRWYLRFTQPPQLATTPLSVAVGRNIEPLLPQGGDAMRVRAQLNELQMLLHDHPVNQAREARGDLPVNSLWLWGGGRQPSTCAVSVPIYASNFQAQALGAFCNTRVHPLPARLDAQLLETDGIILLDALTRAGQYGDACGWRETMRQLEQDWFEPLRRMLNKIGPRGLRLLDPVNGKALHLHARDAWRFWRRSRRLISMLT